MRSPTLASSLLAVAAIAACTDSGSSTPSGVQMNDLSVLLPLPRSQAELDAMLVPTAAARGGQLLPEAVFDSAGGFVGYDQLRAVAFRVDPCFGQLGPVTDPSECHAQLRIVFQPVFFDPAGSDASAEDAGVHAFYALTNDELVALVDELVAARVADGVTSDLGPLAPHATITREGLDGPLARAFDAIVLRYAGAANMIRMTQFVVEFPEDAGAPGSGAFVPGNTLFWELASFDVGSGSATPRLIPTMPSDEQTSSMSISAGTDPLSSSASPATISIDNIAVIEDMQTAGSATSTARQLAFDAALRIQNPNVHSPDTIDCASCHLAGPAIDLVGTPLGMSAAGDLNAFLASPGIPAADLARTTPLRGSGEPLNIHAFSYMNTEPMINVRVINETAANLAYIQSL